MDIGQYIEMILQRRNLTLGDLVGRLGYRSRTSLIRLAKGAANRRSLESFAGRLRQSLDLSPEELEPLELLLEAYRWRGDYQSACEMRAFLSATGGERGEILLDGAEGAASRLSERYRGAKNLKILLLNSQYTPVFYILKSLIREQGAQVEHFMLEDENAARTIHAVNALMQVVYEENYAGYTMKLSPSVQHRGILTADGMAASYDGANGHVEELVVFDAPNHGCVLASGVPGGLGRLLRIPREDFAPVKRTYFQCTAMEDYVQYSRDYGALEDACTLYSIKPDFSLCCVPVEILKAAFVDQCGPVDGALLAALAEIYDQRYKNIFERRTATHTIMKRSAMWRFAKTGRTSDHFWGMRPYTLRERVVILQNLAAQMERNPYYHVYFLKDNQYLRDLEISCYEGRGMLVLDATTDYNLAQGHSEVLVTHPHFLRLFREYFQTVLVRDQVIPHQEAVSFVRMLAEYCENQM